MLTTSPNIPSLPDQWRAWSDGAKRAYLDGLQKEIERRTGRSAEEVIAEHGMRGVEKARPLAVERDPAYWARTVLDFTPDPWQEPVLRWLGTRIALNCSRQSGKSTVAAILALHTALFTPASVILIISPSERQSREIFRKVSDFRRRVSHLGKLLEDNKLSCEFANHSRIVCLPASEETIRGFSRVSLIIEDEAARVSDALNLAVRPMLAVSGGRLMLLSTPFGKRGHFYEVFHGAIPAEDKGWLPIQITAEECPHISAEFLANEKAELPRFWFEQEYMGKFVDTIDQLFTHEDVLAAFDDDSVMPLFGSDPLSSSILSDDVQDL